MQYLTPNEKEQLLRAVYSEKENIARETSQYLR